MKFILENKKVVIGQLNEDYQFLNNLNFETNFDDKSKLCELLQSIESRIIELFFKGNLIDERHHNKHRVIDLNGQSYELNLGVSYHKRIIFLHGLYELINASILNNKKIVFER